MLAHLGNALRKHGLVGVMRRVPNFLYWRYRHFVDHAYWDGRWGTETAQIEKTYLSELDSPEASHAEFYEPIRWRWFKPMMRDVPIAPRDYTFVDLGSGKGRALFFAAMYGFRRVVGVEFAERLHEIATRNRVRFAAREPDATPVELVLADAARYTFPPGPLLIFLNNPFRDDVMAAVVERIVHHVAASGASTFVLYKQPQLAAMFDDRPSFTRIVARAGNGRWFLGKEPYIVYRVTPVPAA